MKQNDLIKNLDNDEPESQTSQKSGQVLSDLSHGEDVPPKKQTVVGLAMPSSFAAMRMPPRPDSDVVFKTPFGYLFSDLKDNPEAHLPAEDPARVVAVLKALGDAMVEDPVVPGAPVQANGNSTIPPVFTYWGQFIDHDLTANTDRISEAHAEISDITRPDLKPIPPDRVVKELVNLRQPTVNLDSVYGDGPTFEGKPRTQAASFYDGIKFRLGKVALESLPPPASPIGGVPVPPDRLEGPDNVFVSVDPHRDLPRIGAMIDEGVIREEDFLDEFRSKENFRQTALIADARNDENLIVAQLHVAFLRFHNHVVDWVRDNEARGKTWQMSEKAVFERARQLTRWHHQWLVVNEFLKTITMPGIVEEILQEHTKHYRHCHHDLFMPLEFSVAAFRFGHTMVRGAYDHNLNFGRAEGGNTPLIGAAPFALLFTFTGKAHPPFRGDTETLPFNWIIQWDRFVDKNSPFANRFARKIDTRLAPPLHDLTNEGNTPGLADDIKQILKRLARRNLLRGYLLSIPTGQSVAQALGVNPLSEEELRRNNSDETNQLLQDNDFLTKTPLWYYVLKEAEVRADGNALGEVGSRIVCETIIGQLYHDPDSYLVRQPDWNPAMGVKSADGLFIERFGDFIRCAGLIA